MKRGEAKRNSASDTTVMPGQLVSGDDLLRVLFPKTSRPTLRWLRDMQNQRRVPFCKIGRLVFFYPDKVRDALNSQRTAQFGRTQ
jgi:hypothetical protein